MPTILLFRHGETHWNRLRRVQGQADTVSPLTLKGIAQARAYGETARRLIGDQPGWRVVSSPLARCTQTAAILCETAGLSFADVAFDDRLKEVNTGEFSGLLKADLKRLYPELMAGTGLDSFFFRCPGGETWDDMAARIGDWLAELRPGEKVLVVSHGVAGKVMRGLFGNLDPESLLAEDSPQDALFRLKGGTVTRVACDPLGVV